MRLMYSNEDKLWFKEQILKLKASNAFNFPGLKNSGFLETYYNRFKKSISIEGLMTLLKRIDDPESAKVAYRKYQENEKLRKQGLLPQRAKANNSQNIGDLLSKYPFIIVINDKVAGYETEEQVKEAIINSQVMTSAMKMFEVKERKIKSQITVDIE